MIIDELVARLGYELHGEQNILRFQRGLAQTEQRMNTFAANAAKFGAAAAAGITAAFAGLTYAMGEAAAEFESQLTEVEKKAGASAEQMAKIRDEISDLATSGEVAVNFEEITAAFERGAAAGIPLDELREFAKLMTIASDAFGMSPQAVSDAAAGFEKGLGVGREELQRYFDLINSLADAGIADEVDIIGFLDKAGASLSTFGMSREEIAALGAALVNLKMPAEVAARAMDTLSGKLIAPENLSSKARGALQDIVGDLGKFATVVGKDANEGLLFFLERLEGLGSQQRISRLGALMGEGFDDEVTRLVAGLDEYRRNLNLANDEEKWLGSLRESYAKKLDDLNSKQVIFWNNVRDWTQEIGDRLLPMLKDGLDDITNWMRDLRSDGFVDWLAEGFEDAWRASDAVVRGIVRIGGAAAWTGGQVVDLLSRLTGLSATGAAALGAVGAASMTKIGRGIMAMVIRRFPMLAALLAVDDLIAGLKGDKSMIGSLPGGQEAIDNLKAQFASAKEAANELAESINGIFGVEMETGETPIQALLASLGELSSSAVVGAINALADSIGLLAKAVNDFPSIRMRELMLGPNIDRMLPEQGDDALTGGEFWSGVKRYFTQDKLSLRDLAGGGAEREGDDGIRLPEVVVPSPVDVLRSLIEPMSRKLDSLGELMSVAGMTPALAGVTSDANSQAVQQAFETVRARMEQMQAAPASMAATITASDNRSFPVTNNITSTVNQTVTEARAPGAAANATSSAVSRAAVPDAARLQQGPAAP